jgi:hypothetical protein
LQQAETASELRLSVLKTQKTRTEARYSAIPPHER